MYEHTHTYSYTIKLFRSDDKPCSKSDERTQINPRDTRGYNPLHYPIHHHCSDLPAPNKKSGERISLNFGRIRCWWPPSDLYSQFCPLRQAYECSPSQV